MLPDIPRKANTVLHIISIFFLLIAVRIAYLTIIEHEHHLEKAKLPRRRVAYTVGERGTIRDRFNYPLAINRVQYDATIVYNHVKEIPRVVWIREKGKKKKVYKRREYVRTLATLLADKLGLPEQDIIDVIYSKAALFPNTPQLLKKGVDEKTYYSLKMLERTWPGIHMITSSERYYPMGKVAGDLLGYIGSINQHYFYKITQRIRALEEYIENRQNGEPALLPVGFTSAEAVTSELKRLKEKAYSVTSAVGRSGLELAHDESLRGSVGYIHYEVDTSGKKIKELPIKKNARPGSRILLNISYELQEYAEALLAQHEKVRSEEFPQYGKEHPAIPNPWIKGGAILAMVPQTGEVVAMASYPRFDPNPFSERKKDPKAMHAQLETKSYVSHVWDGISPLQRERYDRRKGFYMEQSFLTWNTYLSYVLSPKSSVWTGFEICNTVGSAHTLLNNLLTLLDLSEQPSILSLIHTLYSSKNDDDPPLVLAIRDALTTHEEYVSRLRQPLDLVLKKIPMNEDKLLFIDLLRLTCNYSKFSTPLPQEYATISLERIREATQEYAHLLYSLRSRVAELFHTTVFAKWRDEHFTAYLKKKRQEEVEKGTYQHPYIEYLHEAERTLFSAFWKEQKMSAVLSLLTDSVPFLFFNELHALDQEFLHDTPTLKQILSNLPVEEHVAFLETLIPFDELRAPLFGRYPLPARNKSQQTLADLASAFYPRGGFGFARSMSYQHAAPQGSLFKILTAYEGILEKYKKGNTHDLNPLTIIDEIHPGTTNGLLLGFTEDGKPISRRYKGGTLPRSHARIGKTDLFTAMQQSSNVYFSILAGDVLSHPESLKEGAQEFGFGEKTGIELPREYAGVLPRDLRYNKTGLYAFAIGQHAFSCTPLQTARFLSTVVNKGKKISPSIVKLKTAVEQIVASPLDREEYPYKELLATIQCHFPYFSEVVKEQARLNVQAKEATAEQCAYFPSEVHDYLLESMRRVVSEKKGSAHPFRIRGLYRDPTILRSYLAMKPYMIGKSSTAEFRHRAHLNKDQSPIRCNDIWFGAASFEESLTKNPFIRKSRWEKPELVVIVYLRYGDYGKEAAPLAAQIMQRWREILKKEGKRSCVESPSTSP